MRIKNDLFQWKVKFSTTKNNGNFEFENFESDLVAIYQIRAVL